MPDARFACLPRAPALDDVTLRYVTAAQPLFEEIRDVAAQLAGLMVLAGAGASSAMKDHPMLAVSRDRWSAARDGVQFLAVPPGAMHHRRHLLRAAELVGEVLGAIQDAGTLVGRLGTPLPLLAAAWTEIRHTAAALPGFQTLDLTQACCAIHSIRRRGLEMGH